jgi:hypothetical protein
MYYALESTDLTNFSSWITSDKFEKETEIFYDEEVFPLEIIWIQPNDLYYIRRPLPGPEDSTLQGKAIRAQEDIQKELKAIMLDWSRFYSGKLLSDMPAEYSLTSRSDTIVLRYKNDAGSTEIYFGQNGIILETQIISGDSSEIIYTYPDYKFTGEFWLCTGWTVQIMNEGEISSGFRIIISSQRIERYWLPKEIRMILQTKEYEKVTFSRTYFFRNSRVNRDIQILNK